MPTTPLLGIDQVTTSQNQKEITINDAILALENATNRKLSVSYAAATTVLLSDSQATRNMVYEATGATADSILRFPNTVNGQNFSRVVAVRNASGYALTVKFNTGAGTTVIIPNNETRLLSIMDGLNVRVAAEPPTVATFLSLTDTPSSYATFAGKVLAVNVGEDALEFIDVALFPDFVANAGKVLVVNGTEDGVEWITLVTEFTALSDAPSSYTGAASKLVAVKATADGLEFIDPPEIEAVEYLASDQWRIRVITGGTEDQVGFTEVEFRNVDGINVATGGTESSSTFDVSFEPEYAFDSDLTSGTGWLSEAADVVDAYIAYEFAAPVVIRSVKLWPFDPLVAEYTPTQFMIERWDGAAWVEVGERIPLTWVAGEPQIFKVNGVPLTSVVDAPSDGEYYLRRNAAWESTDNIVDTDVTLAANSDAKLPSQKAVKTYVDNAVTGLLDYKGTTDCSANPNYPAASKGDTYIVSVAGKIGGASGTSVDAGDWFIAKADNAGGDEATVGSSWGHIEHNLAAIVLASGGTFTGAISVPDDAYDATAWNASTEVPTKNAIRDKIEGLVAGIPNAATTTEVLTGTGTTQSVTPDALAALWEQGTDVASAGTVSLGEGGYIAITGTTTITDIDFATDRAGRMAWVKFTGALTLTHNGATLILPGAANITTAAGDCALFVSEGSDVVRCISYRKATGTSTLSYYRVGTFFAATTPTASEIIALHVFTHAATLAANFSGSVAYCGTVPTATYVLDVKKTTAAGVTTTVGTISFATSGVATFASSGGTAVTFAAGDMIQIVGSATPDATIANTAITMLATTT